MLRARITLATLAALLLTTTAQAAEPEYVTIPLEIDIAKPAAEVWARVGNFCDIGEWANLDCEISAGDGGVGTVRSLAGGRVKEIMVGRTELSYGYTQPVVEGTPYNLYHGYMEARPVTATTSKMYYTLMLDASVYPDQATREADLMRRRALFEGVLENIKKIAETP